MGGRDPLGLSRVSNIITDYLLTGIITQTSRARYYSFYCWNIWHTNHKDNPSKYRDFVEGFRRREAVVALATLAQNGATSPVGVQAVRPRLERGMERGEVDCNFRVLPSNALGGYGQYYGGSLYELGLTYRPESGIDQITEGMAEALSEAFDSSIRKTPYIKKGLSRSKELPIADLDKSKRFLTLDAIMRKPGDKERRLLTDLFFGFDGAVNDDRTLMRRYTLGQILFILSEYEKRGYEPYAKAIDKLFVYAPYYFNVLWPEENKIFQYKCSKKFELCHSLWRQFCLQQYLTQALENMLVAVLEIVGSESSGLTLEETVSRLLGSTFHSVLKERIGKKCDKPKALLRAFKITDKPSQASSLGLQKTLKPTAENSETGILGISGNDPGAAAARAVLLSAVLYGKWRGIKDNDGLNYVSHKAGKELWTLPFLSVIDTWLDTRTTCSDTLETIISYCVLNQHDRVMYEKGRLDSCWLSINNDRIFKEQDYQPKWRASRHLNAISILRDLCLVKFDSEEYISMTRKGKAILDKILKDSA